jgi:hypothetical protein
VKGSLRGAKNGSIAKKVELAPELETVPETAPVVAASVNDSQLLADLIALRAQLAAALA